MAKSSLFPSSDLFNEFLHGEGQGGIEDATRAISIDSNYRYAYQVRASLNYALSNYKGAMADCEKALGFYEDLPEVMIDTWKLYAETSFKLKGVYDEKAKDFLNKPKLAADTAATTSRTSVAIEKKSQPLTGAAKYRILGLEIVDLDEKLPQNMAQIYIGNGTDEELTIEFHFGWAKGKEKIEPEKNKVYQVPAIEGTVKISTPSVPDLYNKKITMEGTKETTLSAELAIRIYAGQLYQGLRCRNPGTHSPAVVGRS